ncbi:MAG: orotate phosphoribosyltransferase, partial [Planctomycetaceae bacterium]
AVCGPAVEGALLAQMVAEELELAFFFAEKVTDPHGRPTGPAAHQIPESLRDAARRKNFAVVDDVINAGSAVQAVLDDLSACGARPVAIGALLVLGQSAGALAASRKIPLEAVAQHETPLWEPWACPLCAAGRALSSPESDPGEA